MQSMFTVVAVFVGGYGVIRLTSLTSTAGVARVMSDIAVGLAGIWGGTTIMLMVLRSQ